MYVVWIFFVWMLQGGDKALALSRSKNKKCVNLSSDDSVNKKALNSLYSPLSLPHSLAAIC